MEIGGNLLEILRELVEIGGVFTKLVLFWLRKSLARARNWAGSSTLFIILKRRAGEVGVPLWAGETAGSRERGGGVSRLLPHWLLLDFYHTRRFVSRLLPPRCF